MTNAQRGLRNAAALALALTAAAIPLGGTSGPAATLLILTAVLIAAWVIAGWATTCSRCGQPMRTHTPDGSGWDGQPRMLCPTR